MPWLDATIAVALVAVVARIGQQAAKSDGFLWADDYAHLLGSRSVIADPRVLLDVWGRPLMTLAYIPAGLLGDTMARVTSLLLLAAAAVLVWRVARNHGTRFPALAALLLLAQPATAMMGYSALPGVLFSTVLALALWLRSRGQPALAALAAGLLPLARVEGIAVLVAWGATLVIARRWRLLPLLAIGLVAWAVARAIVYQDFFSLLKANPYGIIGSPYGAAGLGYILSAWPLAFGPVVGGLAIVGLAFVRRLDALTAGLVVIMVVFYVAAWTLPLFATIATPLYLVSISVPVALVAHRAAEGLLDALSRTRLSPDLVSGALAVLVASAAVASLGLTLRLPLAGEYLQARHLADVVKDRGARVSWSTTPAFAWYTRADDTATYVAPPPSAIRKVKADELVVWDSQFGGPESTFKEAGFVELWAESDDPNARVVLLQRRATGTGQ